MSWFNFFANGALERLFFRTPAAVVGLYRQELSRGYYSLVGLQYNVRSEVTYRKLPLQAGLHDRHSTVQDRRFDNRMI
jgi:hypothetical protein